MMKPEIEPRVVIVDYGLGNLFSLQRALARVGASVGITRDPQMVRRAPRIILPGVGAFGDGMRELRARDLIEPLMEAAKSGTPMLGICLGMQLLFAESEEFGLHEGLNLLPGRVVRLNDRAVEGAPIKVPHVGWSELVRPPVRPSWRETLLQGVPEHEAMYFVHSFVPVPTEQAVTVAQVLYGGHRYAAYVERENLMGSQFHPEKSGEAGLAILRNFVQRTAEILLAKTQEER